MRLTSISAAAILALSCAAVADDSKANKVPVAWSDVEKGAHAAAAAFQSVGNHKREEHGEHGEHGQHGQKSGAEVDHKGSPLWDRDHSKMHLATKRGSSLIEDDLRKELGWEKPDPKNQKAPAKPVQDANPFSDGTSDHDDHKKDPSWGRREEMAGHPLSGTRDPAKKPKNPGKNHGQDANRFSDGTGAHEDHKNDPSWGKRKVSSYADETDSDDLSEDSAATATASNIGSTTSGGASEACQGPASNCVGDVTYWGGGLGACGWDVDTNSDMQIALPHGLMGQLSNSNPYCGQSLTIQNPTTGATVQATVGDKCMGCEGASIDLTQALFNAIAPDCDGRCHGFQWWFN